eukprot:2083242-Pleurochrysis_carterae.AAC.1
MLVILNVVVMCMPYYQMPRDYATTLETAGTTITVIFICEMVLKLLALGCHGYWSDGWNRLDGTIVLVSTVELALAFSTAGSGVNLSFLRILRMLRVMRVLRLMRQWHGLYKT